MAGWFWKSPDGRVQLEPSTGASLIEGLSVLVPLSPQDLRICTQVVIQISRRFLTEQALIP